MNIAFIIPTGLGASIGGHAGDATPAAKLIAQTCDKILLNPNVVNASDINEMPSNALYVEGSILDSFLEGQFELEEAFSNKILVAVNKSAKPETINAVSASRATCGLDAEIIELDNDLTMEGWVEDNQAIGKHTGVNELIEQVNKYEFDALAIATEITVDDNVSLTYFRNGGINPWGGIESIVSRKIASALNKPVAHAPIESDATKNNKELFEILYDEIVLPGMAPEVISNCYLHCVLKGLHQAPRIGKGLSNRSIGALVTPVGCIGRAHRACLAKGIPIIGVGDNTTIFNERDERIIYVNNYLEAAGYILMLKAGLNRKSISNLDMTKIIKSEIK